MISSGRHAQVGSVEQYLEKGPGFIFLYHPALGPLWDVIVQKVRGGALMPGSELVLEVGTRAACHGLRCLSWSFLLLHPRFWLAACGLCSKRLTWRIFPSHISDLPPLWHTINGPHHVSCQHLF